MQRWFGPLTVTALVTASAPGAVAEGLDARASVAPGSDARASLSAEPQASPWHIEASVTGLLAEPFAASGPLSEWGYGASLAIGARRDPLPFSAGAEIAGLYWGGVHVPVVLQLGDTPTRASVAIRQQTILLDLWLRAQLPRGLVRPYVELVGGLKMLDTEYTLRFPGGDGETSVFAEDTTPASTVGIGAGVELMVARATADPNSGILVTLGVRRLWGSRVSLEHATYGAFSTDTDTVLVSLGFAFKGRLGGSGVR